MKIAFYAPMKPPDHPTPSGDRQIARNLLRALRLRGHGVEVASRLRTFDANGDAARQARLRSIAAGIGDRLAARMTRDAPADLWFTYHLHHKAPDLLGPRVSRALDIPYVVAEASVAPRQASGRWAAGYADALAATKAADLVLFVNPADVAEVQRARGTGARSAMLAPFIDAAQFARTRGPAPECAQHDASARLICVAMMRDGAKLASYRLLAAALTRVPDLRLELSIVGDGPAHAAVVSAFAGVPHPVAFLGARASGEIAALLEASDIFVWPAIDEAIGIAFLEAQACGLPVVGGDVPGVAGVVANGRTGLLAAPGDVASFAAALRRLLQDTPLRARMAAAARDHVRRRHDLPAAAAHLDRVLHGVVERHRFSHTTGLPC